MQKSFPRLLGGLVLAAGAMLLVTMTRRLRRYDFRGRTVLVTGGSRGLGLNLARQLGDAGAHLVICARNPEELDRARIDLQGRGGRVSLFSCDLSSRDAVRKFAAQMQVEAGVPDVVINNAGIISMGPLETMTSDDFDESLRTNFYAALWLNEALLPEMRRRGSGRIVHIASIGGLISIPHLLPYCASKFALVGYSLGLHHELARDGIVVTTVCPGLMRTGSARYGLFKGRHRDEYAWFKVAASLPIVTLSAPRAARQILQACREGKAFVILGMPARGAALLHTLFPNGAARIMALAQRLLPTGRGSSSEAHTGYHSESPLTRSPLTALTNSAAQENNEGETPRRSG